MGGKRIFEKLDKVNSKAEFIFKLEYKGKVLHQVEVEVPEYAKSVLDDEDFTLYYFFKDMALKLEEKIVETHKAQIWKESNKGTNDTNDTQSTSP